MMFQTNNDAHINIPSLSHDEHVWGYVELLIEDLWLFVDCKVYMDNLTIKSSFIFGKPKQLKDLINNPEVEITTIYLVSPPIVNNNLHWKMDPIEKISLGIIDYLGVNTEIEKYELKNGKVYYSQYPDTVDMSKASLELIFNATTR